MADQTNSVLKETLDVKWAEEDFVFKIPSIRDRTKISSYSAKLRRESDPDGMGMSMAYDAGSNMLFDAVATFICLIKEAPPRWMRPDASGNPIINLDTMPDDMPIMEVVNQFYIELDKFRKNGVRPE